MKVINIAKDFSKIPAGKFLTDGPFPGEAFRKQLIAAIQENDEVIVNLDGGCGYGSSFIDGAFGDLELEVDTDKLSFVSEEDKELIIEVWYYIKKSAVDKAIERLRQDGPTE